MQGQRQRMQHGKKLPIFYRYGIENQFTKCITARKIIYICNMHTLFNHLILNCKKWIHSA